jgi:hypothetical protein
MLTLYRRVLMENAVTKNNLHSVYTNTIKEAKKGVDKLKNKNIYLCKYLIYNIQMKREAMNNSSAEKNEADVMENPLEKKGSDQDSLPKEEETPLTKEELHKDYVSFWTKKEAAVAKINEVRTELGLPPTNELPVEIVEEQKHLVQEVESTGISYVTFEEQEKQATSSEVEPKKDEEDPDAVKPEKKEEKEEKPLEIGDEVYKDGVFYKIHDFLPEYDYELHDDYLKQKVPGKEGMSEWEWMAKKKQELAKQGIKPPRRFRAAITSGGWGGGKGAFEHFEESDVTRVTPELKKKIKEMKTETGREEGVN